jgi:type II secretory pathway component PulK
MEQPVVHRRTSLRKYRKRLVTLIVVCSLLCLTIGLLIAFAAMLRMEHERGPFLRLGLMFLGGGTALLAIYGLVFALPDALADRRSGTFSRRRAVARAYQRPARPSPPPARRGEAGSILVIVLVLLGLIATAATHAIVTARAELRLARARADRGLLHLAALDSARAALQQLADDPDLDLDHLGEPWATARESTDPAGITRLVRITDAHRAFDVNNLAVDPPGDALPPREILQSMMVQGGQLRPGTAIEALRDWIDADDSGPWEARYYLEQEPPARIANRLLYDWSELFQVHTWSADLLAPSPYRRPGAPFEHNLGEALTLIPAARTRVIPVNLNTATASTLHGLFGFGREGLVERILARRTDTPYRTTAFLAELLGAPAYAALVPYLDVRSEFFLVQSSAFRDGRMARLDLIARRTRDGRVNALLAHF